MAHPAAVWMPVGRARSGWVPTHLAGHRVDVGALIFGAILLLVGGYYLLVNTVGVKLPELNWDQIWPIAVVGLGLAVLAKAIQSRASSDQA